MSKDDKPFIKHANRSWRCDEPDNRRYRHIRSAIKRDTIARSPERYNGYYVEPDEPLEDLDDE